LPNKKVNLSWREAAPVAERPGLELQNQFSQAAAISGSAADCQRMPPLVKIAFPEWGFAALAAVMHNTIREKIPPASQSGSVELRV
jgi:hypothetical protein